jgi:hypothetical protein
MHRLLQGGGLVPHPAPQTQNIGFEKSPAISVVLYTRDSPRCSSLIVAKPKQNLVYLSIGEVGVRTVDRLVCPYTSGCSKNRGQPLSLQ